MSFPETIQVKIGEVFLGRHGHVLKATLGSCIGIAFLWKRRGVYGLAHCLLPISPAPSFKMSARYVSQAVPSLLAMMKIRPANYSEIQIIVVGGGNMTALSEGNDAVGDLNAKAAFEILKERGLTPLFHDVGGNEGRQIEVDCNTGEYRVLKIPRIEAA